MNETTAPEYAPTIADLKKIFDLKRPPSGILGSCPKLRDDLGYFTADEHYESLISNLIKSGYYWADIGCGRDLFPSNKKLAEELSARAEYLLGIEPDNNVHENKYLSEGFHGCVEDYKSNKMFDMVTLRMVAEHIENPNETISVISQMLKEQGVVVIYTPYKWSLMSILAKFTPIQIHHTFKKILWNTEERDTFPVQYKMNTKKDLEVLFATAGFTEDYFTYVNDCTIFSHYKALYFLELWVEKMMRKIGITYPERCILAVYKKVST